MQLKTLGLKKHISIQVHMHDYYDEAHKSTILNRLRFKHIFYGNKILWANADKLWCIIMNTYKHIWSVSSPMFWNPMDLICKPSLHLITIASLWSHYNEQQTTTNSQL